MGCVTQTPNIASQTKVKFIECQKEKKKIKNEQENVWQNSNIHIKTVKKLFLFLYRERNFSSHIFDAFQKYVNIRCVFLLIHM